MSSYIYTIHGGKVTVYDKFLYFPELYEVPVIKPFPEVEMQPSRPKSEEAYYINQLLDEQIRERDEEFKTFLINQRKENAIERKFRDESERRWRKSLYSSQQPVASQKNFNTWWTDWRKKQEAELKKKYQEKGKIMRLTRSIKITAEKMYTLQTFLNVGNFDELHQLGIFERFGVTPDQCKALQDKKAFDMKNKNERDRLKREEWNRFLEPQVIKENSGFEMKRIIHEEKSLFKNECIYIDVPVKNTTVITYLFDSKWSPWWHFNSHKHYLDFNHHGMHSYRYANGYLMPRSDKMRFNENFFDKLCNEIYEEIPIPPELPVLIQLAVYSTRIMRDEMQSYVDLFGSSGYFEKQYYNTRFEMTQYSTETEILWPYANACPFIENSSYMGSQMYTQHHFRLFDWHWWDRQHYEDTRDRIIEYGLYLKHSDGARRIDEDFYRLYHEMGYSEAHGYEEFVGKGDEVVEYIHEEWDYYRRWGYTHKQRVMIHESDDCDLSFDFYLKILDRVASEEVSMIGFPHREVGRYAFNHIQHSFMFRHTLSVIGAYALYISLFRPARTFWLTFLSAIQIAGSVIYRIYYDGNALIDYNYYPNLFYWGYSPVFHHPGHYYIQFIERIGNDYQTIIERRFYKVVTALVILNMFYTYYWPDNVMCSLPCYMVPPHTWPYHIKGNAPGWFTCSDWPLQYGPPKYAAADVSLSKGPWLSRSLQSVGWVGGLLTVGLTMGITIFTYSHPGRF